LNWKLLLDMVNYVSAIGAETNCSWGCQLGCDLKT